MGRKGTPAVYGKSHLHLGVPFRPSFSRSTSVHSYFFFLSFLESRVREPIEHAAAKPGSLGGNGQGNGEGIEVLRSSQDGYEVGQRVYEGPDHISLQARAAYHYRNQIQGSVLLDASTHL